MSRRDFEILIQAQAGDWETWTGLAIAIDESMSIKPEDSIRNAIASLLLSANSPKEQAAAAYDVVMTYQALQDNSAELQQQRKWSLFGSKKRILDKAHAMMQRILTAYEYEMNRRL